MELEEQVVADKESTENFPPLIKRFQSLIIDQLFIVLCMVLFTMLLAETDKENTGTLRGFLLFGLFLAYEPFCLAFGCTVGNYFSGIRIRKFHARQKRINIFRSYIRFIVKLTLGIISFVTVISHKYKRAIHDMASGSVVIYVRKSNTSSK